MNYLAHILLSGDQPQMMVGGLLGDFVKGPMKGERPIAIEQGIQLHRAIDVYVDQLPEMRTAVNRFSPPFRRYGGIIVDIVFDHLLATKWSQFHDTSLPAYATTFYNHLLNHYDVLPDNARRFADNAPGIGLLERYAEQDAIELALHRVSTRLQKHVPLDQAVPQIENDLSLLNNEFDQLFPQLQKFAADYRKLIDL
jgi:acyl carrier protein phosphodiesterase